MKWVKLVDSEANAYPHGTIFRLRGKYPYEDTVDFMVFDPQVEDKNQSLIVSSGYKAGLILVHLPKESGRLAIEKDWLVNNWAYWVYPECDVSEVYVSDGYVADPII